MGASLADRRQHWSWMESASSYLDNTYSMISIARHLASKVRAATMKRMVISLPNSFLGLGYQLTDINYDRSIAAVTGANVKRNDFWVLIA